MKLRNVTAVMLIAALAAAIVIPTGAASAEQCTYNARIAGANCVEVVVVDELPDDLKPQAFSSLYQGREAECAHLSAQQVLCVLGIELGPVCTPPAQLIPDSVGRLVCVVDLGPVQPAAPVQPTPNGQPVFTG